MIDIIKLLIDLGMAKDERRAKSMLDGGNVSICGMVRSGDKIIPYEYKVPKKEYYLSISTFSKFPIIKVGEKQKLHGIQLSTHF